MLSERRISQLDIKRKYNMTLEENVFWAKRNIVDYIWKSAKLEGISVTFPQTNQIYEGMSVSGVSVKDVITINNLKHAWEFVFDTLSADVDFRYISQLNKIIGGDNLIMNAGYMRNMPVSIGGTTWTPDLPIESNIKDELKKISENEDATDRSITLMLYIMRKQIFLDGNKRTAQLAANAEMIKNGCGVISIPIDKQERFYELLIKFYETNKMCAVKKFIFDNCISGIELKNNLDENAAQNNFGSFDELT